MHIKANVFDIFDNFLLSENVKTKAETKAMRFFILVLYMYTYSSI